MNFAAAIEEHVRSRPTAAALVHDETTVTYRQLNRDANAVANWLLATVVEDATVGLYLPNHTALVTTILGAYKAGVTPLPINYRFTDSEVEHVIQKTDAPALITMAEHADLGESMQDAVDALDQVVLVDDDKGAASGGNYRSYDEIQAEFDRTFETVPRKDHERAMMMFTSGTTGEPKGVQHTNGMLHANCRGYADWLDLSAADVAVNVTPLFHVGGLNITTFPTLTVGGTVVLVDEWDPERFLATAEESGATWSFTIATMVVDLVNADAADEYDLSSMEHIGYGGSPLTESVAEEFEERYGIPIYGGYGMTETTPLATYNPIDDDQKKHGSMGLPHANEVDIRVVDPETGEILNDGEVGELQIRGSTVTPGYYEMPEATEAAFTDDGWFRSGDIVRRDEDGFYWFMDRRDDMIVTGGENVYPKEVEDALYEHEAIEAAAVIGVPDDRFVERVKAVIVSDDEPSTEEIRKHCESVGLADYKQPREVEIVDELPRTGSGKIAKAELE